jgi:hypothetical protein
MIEPKWRLLKLFQGLSVYSLAKSNLIKNTSSPFGRDRLTSGI